MIAYDWSRSSTVATPSCRTRAVWSRAEPGCGIGIEVWWVWVVEEVDKGGKWWWMGGVVKGGAMRDDGGR